MKCKRLLLSTNCFYQFPYMIKHNFRWTQYFPIQTNASYTPKASCFLATDLIKSYFDKGLIIEARNVFDEMLDRDVVAWTAMISGYVSCNEHVYAWSMFRDMVKSKLNPNAFTISSVLKTCKCMHSLSCGSLVHGFAVKLGIEGFIYVDNALMDMYATCCVSMKEACLVFNNIEVKNAVSWTTIIAGYTHKGHGLLGLQIFRQMLLEGEECNSYSFSIAVRACASIGSYNYGQQIHAAVIKQGCESSLPVLNSIVDMYCKCGHLSKANQYFNEMPRKDLITWNALISGYERFDPIEALFIFSQLESNGFSPDCNTFTSITAACANLAVLSCGQQVHGGIIRRGLDREVALANALIDMYAKCGSVTDSHKIFIELSCKNLVSWTSMMIGYGAHGYGKEVVELFDEMIESGIQPDQIVFMAVLSACSHAGLVDHGLRYFNSMIVDYNIEPDLEIYGCVVDLLGRAGRVEEAYNLMESMPFMPDESVWCALLNACKAHGIPSLAATQVLDLRPKLSGTFLMLSNIYASEGKWGEFARVRKLMKGMGNKKEVGRSWIEVRDKVYSFVVGDKVGDEIERVYEVSKWLIQHMDYVPYVDCLLHDLEDNMN
ncbi:putative pentatricopeptide repeat-containing protein At1g56570 [Mercurialis annua]|uniref:putative pentatricopeptide repeat-containing protein At1g56570 n=1 Tax=Mercurialis annua TaxID=3986 RepID=UPI002160829A|nr:putative pentatricopeptide repeat-containing protein At1g56570 [Mercurialis annua]